VETVEKVLAAAPDGVDVQTGDGRGITSLMFAAWLGHAGVVRLLLQGNADTERRNARDMTALEVVKRVHAGDGDTLLLGTGTVPNSRARGSHTMVHHMLTRAASLAKAKAAKKEGAERSAGAATAPGSRAKAAEAAKADGPSLKSNGAADERTREEKHESRKASRWLDDLRHHAESLLAAAVEKGIMQAATWLALVALALLRVRRWWAVPLHVTAQLCARCVRLLTRAHEPASALSLS
jgi:hypothetical protein